MNMFEKSYEYILGEPSTGPAYHVLGKNGRLTCKDCQSLWCEHMEDVVFNHLDTETLWGWGLKDNETLAGQPVYVPIVPTVNQWAEVEFGDPLGVGYKLYLKTPPNDPWVTVDFFLGFISPGEGRQVIRGMIGSWFETNMEAIGSLTKCRATSHDFAAERTFKRDLENSRSFAQRWCLYATGFCLTCSAKVDTVDDLVPDSGSSSTRTPFR